MRKTYRFSHSVGQGGYLYAHKTVDDEIITNKFGLRNALTAVAKRFELIDVTIKIYDSIFFFFFMSKPSIAYGDIIDSIQKNIASFNSWSPEYVYDAVYDLQEEYIRRDLKKQGFNYDEG